MDAMKRFFAIFLGIVFICCVFAYGSNERFSFGKMIENFTSLSDMASIQDVVGCWTEDCYTVDYDYSADFTAVVPSGYYTKDASGNLVSAAGLRLAYKVPGNGKIPDGVKYNLVRLYNSSGEALTNDFAELQGHSVYEFAVLIEEPVVVYYEGYQGGEPVLDWFDSVIGFFKRLHRTIKILVQVLVDAFKNLPNLLPWNCTVPIT